MKCIFSVYVLNEKLLINIMKNVLIATPSVSSSSFELPDHHPLNQPRDFLASSSSFPNRSTLLKILKNLQYNTF